MMASFAACWLLASALTFVFILLTVVVVKKSGHPSYESIARLPAESLTLAAFGLSLCWPVYWAAVIQSWTKKG